MKIHSTCYFKDPVSDHQFIEQWVSKLEKLNTRTYKRFDISTTLGNTVIWSHNSEKHALPYLFIFPGFRTSSLFWDLDNALQRIENRYRIFLVETNGQPTLSDGNTPDIKSPDYGHWAAEVIKQFTAEKVTVAGASFGGLVCLKLASVAPDQVNEIFLLNPGCFQPFSLTLKNLYYNLLPIISPSVKNVRSFLDRAVFFAPTHYLSKERMEMIIDYEVFALTRHIDKAQKPYAMSLRELEKVKASVHLIVGEKDILFPYKRTILAAKAGLKNLESVVIVPGAGHGIETLNDVFPIR